MKCNYFVHDGKQYSSGTTIRLCQFNKFICAVRQEIAIFISYDSENRTYELLINDRIHTYTESRFHDEFSGIISKQYTEQITKSQKPKSFADELNVDGLGIAWMWYVFIMAVAIIFNDRIMIWIGASIIFFSYRKKKLKEAGYE